MDQQSFTEPYVSKWYGLEEVSFREVVYPNGYDMATHAHEQDCLVFVTQGVLTGNMGKNSLSAGRSSLFFVPSGQPHTNQFHRTAKTFDIVLSNSFSKKHEEFLGAADGFSIWERGIPNIVVSRIYREFQNPDRATDLILSGLTMELLGETSRVHQQVSGAAPPWLSKAVEFIHDNLSSQFLIEDIGLAVSIHPAHLSRVFRRHMGCTVGEYLRKKRIEHVSHLVLNTDRPLSELAYEAGFADQSHFTRTFKDLMGMTPLEFRQYNSLQVSDKRVQG